MDNEKNLTGDIMNKGVGSFIGMDASNFTEADKKQFIDAWVKDGNIFNYFMEECGEASAKAWVTTHGNWISEEYIKAFTVYMADCFSHWTFGELKKR